MEDISKIGHKIEDLYYARLSMRLLCGQIKHFDEFSEIYDELNNMFGTATVAECNEFYDKDSINGMSIEESSLYIINSILNGLKYNAEGFSIDVNKLIRTINKAIDEILDGGAAPSSRVRKLISYKKELINHKNSYKNLKKINYELLSKKIELMTKMLKIKYDAEKENPELNEQEIKYITKKVLKEIRNY